MGKTMPSPLFFEVSYMNEDGQCGVGHNVCMHVQDLPLPVASTRASRSVTMPEALGLTRAAAQSSALAASAAALGPKPSNKHLMALRAQFEAWVKACMEVAETYGRGWEIGFGMMMPAEAAAHNGTNGHRHGVAAKLMWVKPGDGHAHHDLAETVQKGLNKKPASRKAPRVPATH